MEGERGWRWPHQVYRHEEEMERSVEFAFATERLALQFVFVLVL